MSDSETELQRAARRYEQEDWVTTGEQAYKDGARFVALGLRARFIGLRAKWAKTFTVEEILSLVDDLADLNKEK